MVRFIADKKSYFIIECLALIALKALNKEVLYVVEHIKTPFCSTFIKKYFTDMIYLKRLLERHFQKRNDIKKALRKES
jgi:hypothetical protein